MPYEDPKVTCGVGWITPADLCCASPSPGPETTTECDGTVVPVVRVWDDAKLIKMASNILYARTCFRYPGLCTREVWPCVSCGCGKHPCCCGAYYAIELTSDFPIQSVTSVEIDGVAFTDFRLDENARIVRTDGQPWPHCNNLGLTSPTNRGSDIRVEYVTGRMPPQELLMACAELACELKKACSGDPGCRLPAHVRSVTRRGVESEVYSVSALLMDGVTGNPLIDHALTVHGRCGQARMADLTRKPRGVRIS